MKVQSDGDSGSVITLQSIKSNVIMDHQPIETTCNQYQRVTPAQMKHLNEVRMQALKSEFDSMEESLRDALRQECRQQNPKTENKRPSVCDSAITKRHNYITVYEHDQRKPSTYRNTPNSIEQRRNNLTGYTNVLSMNVGPAESNHVGNISVDEFQKYCTLLTSRIQKMEEQNVELVKLAEQQKMEYEKVVVQVLESEKSQRLLLSECNSLRQQVQQLANNNRKLKEQHLLNNNPPNMSIPELGKDAFIVGGNGPLLKSSKTAKHKAETPKEDLQQLHGHSVSLLDRYKSFDIASIVELYAALQKETLTDIQAPAAVKEQSNSQVEKRAGSASQHGGSQSANVSHNRQDSNRILYEDPDYASPSSICAAPSCTRCITGSHSGSKGNHCQSHSHQQPGPSLVFETSNQQKRRGSDTSCSSKDVHCFDNNSYVEVEIKQGKSLQNSLANSVEDFQPAGFVNHTQQLRHANDDHINIAVSSKNRPPSIVTDDGASDVFLPEVITENRTVTLSPVSPAKKSELFTNSIEENNFISHPQLQKQPKSQYPNQRSKSKKDSTKPSAVPGSGRSSTSSSKYRKYSRSSSTSELPPPPPPPPSAMVEHDPGSPRGVTRNSISSPALSDQNRLKQSNEVRNQKESDLTRENDSSKHESSATKRMEFLRKLDLWKDLDKVLERPLMESDELSDDEKSIGGRRGSYSKACRKSQSLDHLYEQAITQSQLNGSSRKKPETQRNESMESLSNPISSNMQSSTFTASLSPSIPSRIKHGNRNAPSPTFIVQESACTTSSYEVVMPAKLVKASNHQRNVKSSKNIAISPSPRNWNSKDNGHSSSVPKFSSSANASDFLPAFTEDGLFMINKEKLRNRRFSEGSTGNKQKDKLFPEETKRSQLRRYGSTDSDPAVNKRVDGSGSRLQQPSTSHLYNRSYGSYNKETRDVARQTPPQPRFPATNPHARAESSLDKNEKSWNKAQKSFDETTKLNQNASGKSVDNTNKEPKSPQSSPVIPKQSHIPANTVMQNMAKGVAEEMNRGRAIKKEEKPTKQSPSPGSEDRKKGASKGQSKSFVSLMKAKFSRSTSSGRSGSSEKQIKAMSSFPVTPASSLIDPRTLSLEPDSYLPTSKEGKKGLKQTTGQGSDAAIGRKLSQPYPNGYGEISHQLKPLPEETLPDEGFDESSSMERTGKLQPQSALKPSPKAFKAPSYENIQLKNENRQPDIHHEENSPSPTKQKPTLNSYVNVTPNQLRKPMLNRFEGAETSFSPVQNNVYSPKLKQQHSRNRDNRTLQYENIWPSNDSGQENGSLQKQRIVSDVQLARSCPQNKALPSIAQPITKPGAGDIRRLGKTAIPGSMWSQSEKSKRFQPPHEIEKEFINSMVKAELENCLNDRSAEMSPPTSSVATLEETSRRLPFSSMSSIGESLTTGSAGTISSLGSLPSFESSNSADAVDSSHNASRESPLQNEKRNKLKQTKTNKNKTQAARPPARDESPASPRSKLSSSKVRSTSTSSSPTSKEPTNSKTGETMISRSNKPSNLPTGGYRRSQSEERKRTTTSPLTVTSKQCQTAHRTNKFAPVTGNKSAPTGKASESRPSGLRAPEKIPQSNSSPTKSKISSTTHLHFIPSANAEKNRYVRKQFLYTQPAYENSSIIKQHEKHKAKP